MRGVAAAIAALLIAGGAMAQADHDDPRIAVAMDFVRAGQPAAADAQVAKDLAALPAGPGGARLRGDLLLTYGIAEWSHGQGSRQCAIVQAGIATIRRSVATYRAGAATAPETAVALVSLGDVLRELAPGDPPREADDAYREALRIRARTMPADGPLAVAAAGALAELEALPTRLRGDKAKADAAIAQLDRWAATLEASNDGDAPAVAMRARLAAAEYAFTTKRPDQAMAALDAAHTIAGSPANVAGIWFLLLGIQLHERLELAGLKSEAALVANAYPEMARATLPLHCGVAGSATR